MRLSYFSIIYLVLLLCSIQTVIAQSNDKGSKQYTYTVQKSEGLYRISVKLGTTIDELIKVNPSLSEGVVEGQVIIVPSSATNLSMYQQESSQSSANDDSRYLNHVVEKGQTLYFISQKYDIPIEVIIQNNSGVEKGLVEGSIVRIPKDTQVDAYQKQRSSEYIYHTIAAKETLYGISKRYGCQVDELIDANPGLSAETLSVGNEIRIPKSSSTLPDSNKAQPVVVKSESTLYTIKKRDSLSSISKQFSVSKESIQKANPNYNFFALKVGDQLQIPSATSQINGAVEASEESSDAKVLMQRKSSSKCVGYSYQKQQETFRIAILLPFAANDNLSLIRDGGANSLTSVSKIFLEYYEGALLALDKLKSEGVKIDCYVYDTWPDSLKIKQILAKPEMKKMNLIFGPAYAVNLGMVSDFAKVNKIPLIYPLSSKNYELSENPYLFQINSSDSVVYDNVGSYLAKQANSKIIAINSQSPSMKEKVILEKVSGSYIASGGVGVIHQIGFNPENGFDKLLTVIDKNKNNYIYIPSDKESDVSMIINAIHGLLKRSNASITVIGMPEWLKYQTINAEDVHACNTYIFTRSALDYYDNSTQSFIKEYRMLYRSEPIPFSPYFQYGSKNPNYSRYGILGYDLTYYFVSALKEFGPQFINCLDGYRPPLIQSNFIFKHVSNWGGLYDDGMFLVNFQPDFKIKRITLY